MTQLLTTVSTCVRPEFKTVPPFQEEILSVAIAYPALLYITLVWRARPSSHHSHEGEGSSKGHFWKYN